MRGPLPLDDHDFAAIRAQVMAKIERPRRAPFVWQVAFASLVLAVLSIVVGRQPAVAPPAGTPPVLIAATPGVRASRPPSPGVPPGDIVEKPRRRETRRRSGRDARTPQVARMEIQTADPDVRIIWITN